MLVYRTAVAVSPLSVLWPERTALMSSGVPREFLEAQAMISSQSVTHDDVAVLASRDGRVDQLTTMMASGSATPAAASSYLPFFFTVNATAE